MGTVAGNFVELFSSVQGEGPHVGASTLFVRLGVCDLRCRWCDSPHTWFASETCRIQVARGADEYRALANPVAVAAIVEAAEALEVDRHAFVSITGGEPLLQPEAVRAIAESLRGRGPRIHLETHGLATAALRQVVDVIDVVSMDWKLASDVRRAADPKRSLTRVGEAGSPGRHGDHEFHDDHEPFLEIATRAPEVFAKIVVTTATGDAEVLEAARRIARVAKDTLLVLQPVTPRGTVTERPGAAQLLRLAVAAEAILPNVRVIPQTHPIYGAP